MARSMGTSGGRSSAADAIAGSRVRTRPVQKSRGLIRWASGRRVIFRRESNLKDNVKQFIPAQQLKNTRKRHAASPGPRYNGFGGLTMKALEFQSQLNSDKSLPAPSAVAQAIPEGQKVRV